MDFYEQLVEFYLTAIQRQLVSPQFIVRDDLDWKGGHAALDFLAYAPDARRLTIVEVSKSRSIGAVRRAVAKRLAQRPVIERYLTRAVLPAFRVDMSSVSWMFVTRANHKRAIEELVAGNATVEALEDVIDAIKDRMP
jgi:hypothetical protein